MSSFDLLKSIDSEAIAEIGEVLLDSELPEGLLKDIPIINTIISLTTSVVQLREKFLIIKLTKFLKKLSEIPQAEREKFTNKISNDSRVRKIISENLLLILDKITDLDKPKLLAITLILFIKEEISVDELIVISEGIERCSSVDLLKLEEFDKKDVPESSKDRLFSAGFLGLRHASGFMDGGGSGYYANDITNIMVKIIIASKDVL